MRSRAGRTAAGSHSVSSARPPAYVSAQRPDRRPRVPVGPPGSRAAPTARVQRDPSIVPARRRPPEHPKPVAALRLEKSPGPLERRSGRLCRLARMARGWPHDVRDAPGQSTRPPRSPREWRRRSTPTIRCVRESRKGTSCNAKTLSPPICPPSRAREPALLPTPAFRSAR